MKEYKSFEDYLTSVYYNEFHSAVSRYLYNNKLHLDIRHCRVTSPDYIQLQNFHIRSISYHQASGSRIDFHASVEADTLLKEDWDEDETDIWCSCRCSADFNNGLRNFRINNVEDYSKDQFRREDSLTKYLVPYLYAEDLDKAAEDFLGKYYKEALLQPMALDMNVLLRNMGLKAVYAPLEDNIFGMTYFKDSEREVCDANGENIHRAQIRAGTVVVNPNAYFIRNVGSVRTTIVHECVHWDRHRRFFEMQRLLNRAGTAICCEVVDEYSSKNKELESALKWMEWQANALAPRILMPARTARNRLAVYLRQAKEVFPKDNEAGHMEWAVAQMADLYKVPLISAKIRAVELGFDDAEGTSVYVNGRYYPAYSFKRGTLKKNQTFVIDVRNALFLMATDPVFDEMVSSGKVIYANGMFAINDEKYVGRSDQGTPILTRYALEHVDECCLIFDRQTQVSRDYDDSFYRVCFLCNNINSNCVIEAYFNKDYKCNQDVKKRAEEVQKSSQSFKEILDNMKKSGSMDFGETLAFHIKRKGLTNEVLAERSNLTATMISYYRNNKDGAADNIKKDTVISLCIGLNLKSEYAFDLIEKAGYKLKMNERDMLIKYLILNHSDENLIEWNRTLNEFGYVDLDGNPPSEKLDEENQPQN